MTGQYSNCNIPTDNTEIPAGRKGMIQLHAWFENQIRDINKTLTKVDWNT